MAKKTYTSQWNKKPDQKTKLLKQVFKEAKFILEKFPDDNIEDQLVRAYMLGYIKSLEDDLKSYADRKHWLAEHNNIVRKSAL